MIKKIIALTAQKLTCIAMRILDSFLIVIGITCQRCGRAILPTGHVSAGGKRIWTTAVSSPGSWWC